MTANSDNKKTKSGSGKKIKKFFLILFIVTVLVFTGKLFFVQSVIVANNFMNGSLTSGDVVIVNKSAYKLKTPETIPFLSRKMKTKVLIDFDIPEYGDIIYIKMQNPNIYNLKNLFSRCIALPGDTLIIRDKKIFVNREEVLFSKNVSHNRSYSIPFGVEEKEFYFGSKGWNQDNFGPIILPKKGDRIKLTLKNFDLVKDIIQSENKYLSVTKNENKILLGGEPEKYYKIKDNYYFVLGDNRDIAIDSRYIGFIKESSIIGKAEFVLFSLDNENFESKNETSFNSIKWDRFFQILK